MPADDHSDIRTVPPASWALPSPVIVTAPAPEPTTSVDPDLAMSTTVAARTPCQEDTTTAVP